MSPRLQALVAVGLVAGAAAVVWVMQSPETTPAGSAEQAMEGHDHAAMMAGTGEARPVQLSVEGARRIGVTFATAEERALRISVATVGRVTYDETRLATITPRVGGWVEDLKVGFTGAPVRKGEALLELYSPQLVVAQEELILARRLSDDGAGRAGRNGSELLESARRRLAYWDVGEEQIRAIEESGEIQRTITLRSPANGVVVEKSVVGGDRVVPATTLYRVADLSHVWIEADVYEKDLALVTEGLDAVITLEAYPGEAFIGTITYVYPTVSMEARTGSIRVELDNPGTRLKPGMYANLRVIAEPRAPRVIVPRAAVLATGTRSLVFVVEEGGALAPRAVLTGLSAGEEVEILSGLTAGEYVVSSASFLVDAEANLGAAMAGMEGDPGGGMPPAAPVGDGGTSGGDPSGGVDHSSMGH